MHFFLASDDDDLDSLGSTEVDMENLLACLRCHEGSEENVGVVEETLHTIKTMCSNNEMARDALRDVGGLNFLLHFLLHAKNVAIQKLCLLTMAAAIEKNVHNQHSLTSGEMFEYIHIILEKHGEVDLELPTFRVVIFLLMNLVSDNSAGQSLMLEKGCLEDLIKLYRLSFPSYLVVSEDGNNFLEPSVRPSLTIWQAINTILCFAVNNPRNEINQLKCAALFTFCLKILGRCVNEDITRGIASFMALAIANNGPNQDVLSDIGGLTILHRCLETWFKRLMEKALHDEASPLTVVLNVWDAAVTDHSMNANVAGELDVIPLLLHLMENSQPEIVAQAAITLGHCVDSCEKNCAMLLDLEELPNLLQKLIASQSEDVRASAKYLLCLCLEYAQKHPVCRSGRNIAWSNDTQDVIKEGQCKEIFHQFGTMKKDEPACGNPQKLIYKGQASVSHDRERSCCSSHEQKPSSSNCQGHYTFRNKIPTVIQNRGLIKSTMTEKIPVQPTLLKMSEDRFYLANMSSRKCLKPAGVDDHEADKNYAFLSGNSVVSKNGKIGLVHEFNSKGYQEGCIGVKLKPHNLAIKTDSSISKVMQHNTCTQNGSIHLSTSNKKFDTPKNSWKMLNKESYTSGARSILSVDRTNQSYHNQHPCFSPYDFHSFGSRKILVIPKNTKNIVNERVSDSTEVFNEGENCNSKGNRMQKFLSESCSVFSEPSNKCQQEQQIYLLKNDMNLNAKRSVPESCASLFGELFHLNFSEKSANVSGSKTIQRNITDCNNGGKRSLIFETRNDLSSSSIQNTGNTVGRQRHILSEIQLKSPSDSVSLSASKKINTNKSSIKHCQSVAQQHLDQKYRAITELQRLQKPISDNVQHKQCPSDSVFKTPILEQCSNLQHQNKLPRSSLSSTERINEKIDGNRCSSSISSSSRSNRRNNFSKWNSQDSPSANDLLERPVHEDSTSSALATSKCPGCNSPSVLGSNLLHSKNYFSSVLSNAYTCQKHQHSLPFICLTPNATNKEYDPYCFTTPSSEQKRNQYSEIFSESSLTSEVSSSEIHPPSSAPRRKPIPYTVDEEKNLLEGATKMNKNWKSILYSYEFHPSRTAIDLYDKYRRMQKKHSPLPSNKTSAGFVNSNFQPFTINEDRRITRGVRRFGYNWKMILKIYKFGNQRTASSLRERWRNLCNRKK